MLRKIWSLIKTLILFCVFIVFLTGWSVCSEKRNAKKSITIYFTTKNNGVLKDCECAEKCQGGLPERATLFREFRQRNQQALFLDAGDFLTTIGRQRKDEYVIQAYEKLEYDAIAIGDQEFRNGWNFFKYKTFASNLPLICANLREKVGLPHLVEPFVIKEINGCRIGIVGIISTGVFEYIPKTAYADLEILPFFNELKKVVAELLNKSDLIIVLAHLKDEEIQQVAQNISGIDIIIQGHRADYDPPIAAQIDDKFLINAGVEGAYVGEIRFNFEPKKKQQNFVFKSICIADSIFEDPSMLDFIEPYFFEFDLLRQQYGPIAEGMQFYGSSYCRQCHVLEYDQWVNSRHAHAFNSIENSANKLCWKCHSMAGKAQQPDNSKVMLKNVQCDACHRYVSAHIDPAISPHPDNKAREQCQRCHDSENSPNFNFEVYWEKIQH